MKIIRGICPIVAATFTADGELDRESFRSLVRHLLHTGARGLTIFGLATEFYKLTDEEKQTMMRILLDETSCSADVAGIVSITDHAWEVAVRRAQEAEAAGADGLMILPPFFLGASEAAVMNHIRKIASAITIPIVVQYAPVQTGVRLPPEIFVRLNSEFDQIQFVKVECQPPGPYVTELKQGSGGKIKSLVGYAGIQMPDALGRGAVGIQPGCSFTEIYCKLFELFEAGATQSMLELHGKLLPFISYWMQGIELLIKAEKIILKKRGIIESDYCRATSYAMDDRENQLIEAFLTKFPELLGSGTGK